MREEKDIIKIPSFPQHAEGLLCGSYLLSLHEGLLCSCLYDGFVWGVV
jgi:hypothetical protein